jgi:hypothetical protein
VKGISGGNVSQLCVGGWAGMVEPLADRASRLVANGRQRSIFRGAAVAALGRVREGVIEIR